MINQKTARQETTFRMAVPVKKRPAVTLKFLATGDSYHSLSYTFKLT